jgi:hypothetical protein
MKITREIGLAAESEKRTCRADASTLVESSLLTQAAAGFDTSQLTSSIGDAEASPIRELRTREVITLFIPL